MFTSLGLFDRVPCPDKKDCKRTFCIFSHAPDAKEPFMTEIPVTASIPKNVPGPSKPATAIPAPARTASNATPGPSILVKRQNAVTTKSYSSQTSAANSEQPPRKLQKLSDSSAKPLPSAKVSTTGVPVLRVNAAQSRVAIPVRQAMLKTLYETFALLYSDILSANPTLASEHALTQEQEVYDKSTKLTYRNAVISCVATLKKRPKPTSIAHDSVGTNDAIKKRLEERDRLSSLHVTKEHLAPHVMSAETMEKWGFMTKVPEGEGGTRPSEEGKIRQCERCNKQFVVRRKEEAEECIFHWGRPQMNRINGEKVKVWTCCSTLKTDNDGCSRGPHVFYESATEDLHARHPFTPTRPAEEGSDTALDVVCLDCEMVYTTGGSRVARVSVIDGSGKEVFDELVKMDEGVEIIDFNTRFSGITEEEYKKAVFPLASIRRSLDVLINSETIIIGHALDNDLKTLRMIHNRCVDTVILFPHRMGAPYRRSLRDLAREHLGRVIQVGGGTSGHSSVEDSIATLDLVRWYMLNNNSLNKQGSAS